MNEENVKKETTEYLIVKSNDLIQTTAFRLTNAQYDLLNYMVMKIKPTDTDLYPQTIITRTSGKQQKSWRINQSGALSRMRTAIR